MPVGNVVSIVTIELMRTPISSEDEYDRLLNPDYLESVCKHDPWYHFFNKRYGLDLIRGRSFPYTLEFARLIISQIGFQFASQNYGDTKRYLYHFFNPEALKIVERTVGNAVISGEIQKARERVTDGTTISGPLAAGKVLPAMMIDMLAIGEQTGDMPGALSHIARRYENELDRSVKVFTTALEPILIVLIAIAVGFVAISILMAVFNLTNGLNV